MVYNDVLLENFSCSWDNTMRYDNARMIDASIGIFCWLNVFKQIIILCFDVLFTFCLKDTADYSIDYIML